MSEFKNMDGALLYTYDWETLRIEPWGENSLRVRATRTGRFEDQDWALSAEPPVLESKIEILQDRARITNGRITAEVLESGMITYYNQEGRLLLREYLRNRNSETSEFCSALMVDARQWCPIPGGDYELTVRFESSDRKEKIFGMGQYQQDILNLKGMTLELAHRNSQASVPFCLSSLGYGFLWNNPAIGDVVFGTNVTQWHARSCRQMDYWITAGDTPAQIEEAYASVTGTVPMMPDYGMGMWQCKLRYSNQEQLMRVAREYQKRGLKISVIVIDFFHWTHQGDWCFDPECWPDPEGMIRELKEMGIELMVSIWPTVENNSVNYPDMLEKGYLIQTDRGLRTSLHCNANTLFYDATNPGARDFVWNQVKKNYYDKGIKIFWLDEAEPEYSVYDFDNYRYHMGTDLQVGNIYPVMYAKTFFDGMQQQGQENIINLIRCAWAGSQKYGALVWSGDIHSSFKSFRNQLAAGLNMAIAGIPWWTTDIGGFHGGCGEDPAFRELFIRWFQWGTFCPVMRMHGNRIWGASIPGSNSGQAVVTPDNEVWSFGEENYEICRKYMAFRDEMKPYITELMRQAHEKGTPVMRPVFYDFSADPQAWEVEDQYMFGPSLLVAPITYAGMRSRKVYLPAGCSWKNSWTGETLSGGQTVEVSAPIDRIPLFSVVR